MNNKQILPFFMLILVFLSLACTAQKSNDKIDYIAFDFSHSLRIPNHTVSIEIIERQNEVVVNVKSYPMKDAEQWQSTIVDTSFTIDKDQFIELINKAKDLKKIDLAIATLNGLDGTECSIEFGTKGNTTKYKFWTPDYETNTRGLSDFLDLCKELIKVGGLNPKDVL